MIIVGSTLLSEALFLPLMLGALVGVFAHRASTHRYRWPVGVGVLAGLSILTRSNAALLLVPLAIGLYTKRPRVRWRDLSPVAALVASAVLVVLPWTIRNVTTFDSFVPVTTQASYTLAGTYNDAARLDRRLPAAWRPATLSPEYKSLVERRDLGETGLGEELGSAVSDYVRAHPTYVLRVGFWNTVRLLHLDGTSFALETARFIGVERWLVALGVVSFYVALPLALVGAFTRRARRIPLFVWLTALLLWTVVLVVSSIRFRTPVDPFLLMLASVALVTAWERLTRRFGQRSQSSVSLPERR